MVALSSVPADFVMSVQAAYTQEDRSDKALAQMVRQYPVYEMIQKTFDWSSEERFRLAMECARQRPLQAWDHGHRFNLSGDQHRQLVLQIARSDYQYCEALGGSGFDYPSVCAAGNLCDDWGGCYGTDYMKKQIRTVDDRLYNNRSQLGIVKRALDESDPVIAYQVCRFVVYALLMLNYTVDDLDWIEEKKLLETILDFRRPNMRHGLLDLVFDVGESTKTRETYDSLPVPGPKARWQVLTHLAYAKLLDQGVARSAVDRMIALTESSRGKFRNFNWHIPLIEMLNRLAKTSMLSGEEKQKFLERLDINDPKELLDSVRAAIALLVGQNELFLLDETAALKDHAGVQFGKKLALEDVDGVASRVFETFGASRNPSAIYTYSAKILAERGEDEAKLLRLFVKQVLQGTFKEQRYDLAHSKHLASCFKDRPELLDLWKSGAVASVDSLVGGKDVESGLQFLKTQLLDNQTLDLRPFPFITLFLQCEGKQVIQEFERVQENLHRIPPRMRTDAERKEAKGLAVQAMMFDLVQVSDLSEALPKLKQLRKKLIRAGFEGSAFNGLLSKKITEIAQAKRGSLQVMDSDDPYDLLLVGTEVSGSCQNVNFDPFYSVCLLGYLLNGRNRVLRVTEGEGKPTVARCMLRLILGPDGTPALLREKFYPSNISDEHKLALIEMGKRKAAKMGLPLVSSYGQGEHFSHVGRAYVEQGRSRFEYADAGDGRITSGAYGLYELYRE